MEASSKKQGVYMTINNDNKILELKEQITKKKNLLGKAARFSPQTNCILNFQGATHNLNVLTKEQLIPILLSLESQYRIAVELEIEDEFILGNYKVLLWLEDLHSKLNYLNKKKEEAKLKAMEDKLSALLSNEKRVELELAEIANDLGF